VTGQPLRFSLTAFGLEIGEYAPLALAAEREGFDTLWLGDHLISPVGYESTYPYSPTGGPGHAVETPMLDVWVNIGNLACATTTIKLATGVLVLPLRNPFVTARAAASAQALSGGRLTLGVGSGWLREEFEAVGERFESRGARTDELIGILRRLWSGAPVSHEGESYRFGPVRLVPRPEPAIPIVVGGLSRPAIRRAARLGDGWFGPACPLEQAVAARDAILAERRTLGLDGRPFAVSARIELPVERDRVLRFFEAGFDHLVITGAKLAVRSEPLSARLDALARAAEILRAPGD
jgi:probable F420-dependent oxidoreductase